MFRYYDSFSHYDQALMSLKWDVVSDPYAIGPGPSSTPVLITHGLTIGRFGGGGVEFSAANNPTYASIGQADDGQYLQRNYDGVSDIHVGLAVKQINTQITVGGRLLTFMDGATTQVGIDIMPSGQLQIIKSTLAGSGIYLTSVGLSSFNRGTYDVIGLTGNSILSNAFDYLQFKITHHPSNGIVEIRRGDGSAFETITGLNTAVSGNNQSSSVLLGGYGAAFTATFGTLQAHYLRAIVSDFLLYDTVANGSDALDLVTFCGDRHGERISLTADGFYAQSTPSTGSTRFDLIEEVPPNTSDFNTYPSAGIKDTYVVGAASGPAAATLFIVATAYVQKTGGGANEMKMLYRLGGADRNGTAFQVPAPWAFKQSALFSKPGGGAITVADVQPGTGQIGLIKTV